MIILIIDDELNKIYKIVEEAERMGIECIGFQTLEPTLKFLETGEIEGTGERIEIDGIITDMQYPIHEGICSEEDNYAGKYLIKWLIENKKEIPVLGNSICFKDFKTDYPHYEGMMPGLFNSQKFESFISVLKGIPQVKQEKSNEPER